MKLFLLIVIFALFIGPFCVAEIPSLLYYQGYLQDDQGVPVSGTYDMTFTLYNLAENGDIIWQEEYLQGEGHGVVLSNGKFEVLLGTYEPIPDTAFNSPERWLGLKVGDDNEISPRTRIVSVGYSYHSLKSDTSSVVKMIPTIDVQACDDESKGVIYYNSDLNELCFCNGNAWIQVDGDGECACVDVDGDGYDICSPENPMDTDGFPKDCDDNNESVYPGSYEICDDGLDNDCDGLTDCNDSDCGCTDLDGDGAGYPASPCCSNPLEDCDDSNELAFPGMTELCDGFDNNCDGYIDESFPGEGAMCPHGPANSYCEDGHWECINGEEVCVPQIAPGEYPEDCGAPLDEDCDGYANCEDDDCLCDDRDGDGYGRDLPGPFENYCCPAGPLDIRIDCDDDDNTVYPDAPEICDDGKDNDCDGLTDCDDPDCACNDLDDDGYGYPASSCCSYAEEDCDDSNEMANPGMPELCDGIDNNCDGNIDESFPGEGAMCPHGPGGSLCEDGHWECINGEEVCVPQIAPGEYPEDCGGWLDEDCDGYANCEDDDCFCDDRDGDGYGRDLPGPFENYCCPAGPLDIRIDCDDNDNTVYPDAPEICDDGKDNDCDGLVDGDDPDCGG